VLRSIVALLAGLLLLTACGSETTTPDATQETKQIKITFEGDTVTPNGDRVVVGIGQKVQFIVSSDAAGEIHVHSDPEQELPYNQGTTILDVGSFDTAGVIEVESHDLDKIIVQLQVQ
jgi:hypothetical protein